MLAASATHKTARGARDGTAIALLYGLGMNPAEISALNLADYDHEQRRLRLWSNTASER